MTLSNPYAMYKHFYVVYKLMNSTVSFSTVFIYVTEALHGMEAVAEHINEMQKIYEEYGSTFDELAKQYRDYYPHSKVPVSDMSFLYCLRISASFIRQQPRDSKRGVWSRINLKHHLHHWCRKVVL